MQFLHAPVLFLLSRDQFQSAELLIANKKRVNDDIECRQRFVLLPLLSLRAGSRRRSGRYCQSVQSCDHLSVCRRVPSDITIDLIPGQGRMPNTFFFARVQRQIVEAFAQKVELADMNVDPGEIR